MTKIIGKNKVTDLLGRLSDFDVFAPAEKGGVVFYLPIKDSHLPLEDDLLLDFSNSGKPPKDVFFPQTEKMFDFKTGGGKEGMRIIGVEEPVLSGEPILLFGVRPCDARAMTILDTVFSRDYVDPYYMNRRRNATIISFGCTLPGNTCFCTSMGGSPGSTEGSDMLWTDLGDRYLVESLTDKGNMILERGSSLFTDAGEADETAAGDVKQKAEDNVMRTLDIEGVEEALEGAFGSDYWEEFARRCLGCGICTLLCPTCHCFDINDIVTRGKAWRERTWDTCQTSYYSVHASGHNPRPEKSHRQRNRIYHKFLYMGKNLEVIGCVGCGRCISGCPVNIDIIEVVEGVKGIKGTTGIKGTEDNKETKNDKGTDGNKETKGDDGTEGSSEVRE